MKRVSIAIVLLACALLVTAIASSHLAAAWKASRHQPADAVPSIVAVNAEAEALPVDPSEAFGGTDCYELVIPCGNWIEPPDICASASTLYWIRCDHNVPYYGGFCQFPVTFKFQTGSAFSGCQPVEFCGIYSGYTCEFTPTQVGLLDANCHIVNAILCCFEEECPRECDCD